MPKYDVNIEGTIHEWQEPEITVAQIRELGDYAAGQEVIEVDLKDQSERVLAEGESVKLKPGKGFSKKVSFKRG
ncbi:MAG: multiubiquitin domain-containing protein [Solirubrobacterales bacterium]